MTKVCRRCKGKYINNSLSCWHTTQIHIHRSKIADCSKATRAIRSLLALCPVIETPWIGSDDGGDDDEWCWWWQFQHTDTHSPELSFPYTDFYFTPDYLEERRSHVTKKFNSATYIIQFCAQLNSKRQASYKSLQHRGLDRFVLVVL